jgi:hypothetical protein
MRRRKMKNEERKQLESRIFKRKLVHMNRPFTASVK